MERECSFSQNNLYILNHYKQIKYQDDKNNCKTSNQTVHVCNSFNFVNDSFWVVKHLHT